MTLLEYLINTAAQTKPHNNLESKPCMLLKERSCHSQPVPRAQPPPVLWHVSTCLLFFPLHSSPLSHRGLTSHRIGVCDPGAQTALHINLPGPPAVHLSAAAPLLRWMCYSHTPLASVGHWKCRLALFCLWVFFNLVLFHCLLCPGSALLSDFMKPKLRVDELPHHNYGQLPSGLMFFLSARLTSEQLIVPQRQVNRGN